MFAYTKMIYTTLFTAIIGFCLSLNHPIFVPFIFSLISFLFVATLIIYFFTQQENFDKNYLLTCIDKNLIKHFDIKLNEIKKRKPYFDMRAVSLSILDKDNLMFLKKYATDQRFNFTCYIDIVFPKLSYEKKVLILKNEKVKEILENLYPEEFKKITKEINIFNF